MSQHHPETRILGIDPGLQVTGYAVVISQPHDTRLLDAGVIRTSPGAELAVRLKELFDGIESVLTFAKPDQVAIEALFSNYRHPRSALMMAHARGILVLAAANHNLPIHTYEPTMVKKSLTGQGRASKSQVQGVIQAIFKLSKPLSPHDASDAAAIALCHLNSQIEWNTRGGNSTPVAHQRHLKVRRRTRTETSQYVLDLVKSRTENNHQAFSQKTGDKPTK